MDIKKLLGRRIQEIRKSKKLTQEYVAEMVDIEPASLSNIENGKYYPTAENLNKIIRVLKVKPRDLYTFEHLASSKELIDEMNTEMENNSELVRLMYKFFTSVK